MSHLIWNRPAGHIAGRGNGLTVSAPVREATTRAYRAYRKSGAEPRMARERVWNLLFFTRLHRPEFVGRKDP